MELRCVVLNKEQQRQIRECGWIPEDLDFVPEKSIFFGGMTKEKKLAAVAVYSGSPSNAREMKLVYTGVAKKWRGNGLGIQLLALSAQQLKKRGIQRFCSEWQGTEEELSFVEDYLGRAGYAPVMEPCHLCICPQGYFQNGVLEKLKDAQPREWYSVIEIPDYYDRRLKKLLMKRETTGFYISEDEFAPELCRFYIEDDEIRAAACMRYRRDGGLISVKGYLSPDLKYKYAMTMMIAVLIHDTRTLLKPENKVYLKVYRGAFYESVKKLFGEIPEECYFQEYERKMGGR